MKVCLAGKLHIVCRINFQVEEYLLDTTNVKIISLK